MKRLSRNWTMGRICSLAKQSSIILENCGKSLKEEDQIKLKDALFSINSIINNWRVELSLKGGDNA